MSQSFQMARLEEILREELPLARFMDVRVEEWDEAGLSLSAPGTPNQNLHGTMFGGSIAALALFAGWGLLRLALLREDLDPDIVIQHLHAHYSVPIQDGAQALARTPDAGDWARFLRTLRRRGRSRILLKVEVREEGSPGACADFDAWFVAVESE